MSLYGPLCESDFLDMSKWQPMRLVCMAFHSALVDKTDSPHFSFGCFWLRHAGYVMLGSAPPSKHTTEKPQRASICPESCVTIAALWNSNNNIFLLYLTTKLCDRWKTHVGNDGGVSKTEQRQRALSWVSPRNCSCFLATLMNRLLPFQGKDFIWFF